MPALKYVEVCKLIMGIEVGGEPLILNTEIYGHVKIVRTSDNTFTMTRGTSFDVPVVKDVCEQDVSMCLHPIYNQETYLVS